MMNDIARLHINNKLNPQFLTAMTNVIIVLHKVRDEETDKYLETEVKEEKARPSPIRNRRTATLGPRKQYTEAIPKIIQKKSILDYNSSDSGDTMISKIPLVLYLDENTIAKLKQRIYKWAAEHQVFETKDVPIKLVLKNLDQIYSGSYRSLSVVSIAEARLVQLPSWVTRRLKQKTTEVPATESEPYRAIKKKQKTTIHNSSGHSISQHDNQEGHRSETPEPEKNKVQFNTLQSQEHTET
jgi:hypothetical protein